MNDKAIRRALENELHRRSRLLDIQTLKPETISNGHKPQCLLLQDEHERLIVLCSRRAGKSVAVCAKMAHDAIKYPNSIIIYFGATGKAVRLLIWDPVWKAFRQKWGVGGHDREDMMTTRFANGSVVAFAGTDDYKHVESYLGGKLRGVAIDEAQSQPNSVLLPLVDRILPPALSDLGGWLMLSGTIPEVEAGMFYDIWKNNENWSHHNWNRFANPHIESEKALMKELVNSKRSIHDPIIRRDWFGEFVFTNEYTAFGYDRAKHGYDGVFPSHLNLFSVGIDPGTRDRTAIVVWGWSSEEPILYHVHEWVTPRNSGINLSDIANELKRINNRWPGKVPFWYMDMGSSTMAIDTFGVQYGVPVVKAANKSDRLFQVKRLADLLQTGKAKVRIGSALEEDLQRAQWDKDARAQGRFEWSSIWHPDVADAGRYGAQGYFDVYSPPKEKPDVQSADALKEEQAWRDSLREPMSAGDVSYDKDLTRVGLFGQNGKGY